MLWCPTAATRRDPQATYVTRHGRGHTRLERIAHGIASSLLQYVPVTDPVKITRIQLHNQSERPRTLSVTAYVEWVLGAARSVTAPSSPPPWMPRRGAVRAQPLEARICQPRGLCRYWRLLERKFR
ncbi:hypothetical protein RAA17_11205 [Komagataeibacter rhaeticus]|nr:hypothetical protein [Komagataeibacter rhaeticus]